MGELSGKAVVITGAGRSIGAACARGAARRGAAVVVNDIDEAAARDVVRAIVEAGGRAEAHAADVSEWAAADGLIQHCLDAFGRIDGLVNNAVAFRIGRLDELEEVDVRRVFEVNLVGAFACAAHAVKPMKAQGSGSIVNMVSGSQMGVPNLSIYGASKGGLASATYTWSIELKDCGVRVNAVSPMARTGAHAERDAYLTARGQQPLGAPDIPPENSASVVEFLLSDRAANVTGQVVRIDGRQLGLCTHPGILTPLQDADAWTFESVSEAFERDLARRLLPAGVTGMEVTITPNPSAFWNRAAEAR
jgi:NAD(P)-dependent dehydrogenase (short-subunit alcohol dehydrogenase family)